MSSYTGTTQLCVAEAVLHTPTQLLQIAQVEGKKKKKKKSDDFISRSRLLRRQESIQNSAARMAMTLI